MTTSTYTLEQRVILHNVSWQTYEHLLVDHTQSSAPRFAFDRGTLEIRSPSAEHEEYNRTIALIVEVIAEEMGIDVRNLGSTTFQREDLERGFEPDSCFYIQNETRISGKASIDLTIDPPPDLVVEIDITSGSLNKFPIYAQIGVPEIWRYTGQACMIFRLAGVEYVACDTSQVLSGLTRAILSHFLEQSKVLKRTAWLRLLRAWIRQQGPG